MKYIGSNNSLNVEQPESSEIRTSEAIFKPTEHPEASIDVNKRKDYNNNIEHLFGELDRIDLIVRLGLNQFRNKKQGSMNEFQGLYISEEEVNAILQIPPSKSIEIIDSYPEMKKIEFLTKEINIKKKKSIEKGIELRLNSLTELFHLNTFEVNVLLICLAPELYLKYEKLYAYLQNDVTKKRPSVDLVINLLKSSNEERLRARENFSAAAHLIKNYIIYLSGDGHEGQLPLLSNPIKIDERIISYILGSNEIDAKIRKFSTIKKTSDLSSFDDLILPEEIKNILFELIDRHYQEEYPKPEMLFFQGPYGTGKKMTAETVCRELDTPLLVVDSKALIGNESLDILSFILREGLLQNSSLYFEHFDALLKDEDSKFKLISLIQQMDRIPNLIFLSGEISWEPSCIIEDHHFTGITFALPSFSYRIKLWESFLEKENYHLSDNIDITALATKFKFSGGQIKDAIFTAHNISRVKEPYRSELSMTDFYQGCKAQSNKNLITFAKILEPHYTWDDIILPKDTKEQLKEVNGYIEHKGTVYAEWGFENKFSLGKGLNILFSGSSGAGKTMAAEIIGNEVELDIYKIDLSSVVSKYIGETEKILEKIFNEAETSNAILFFDEADALFGKRSETRDSHDRYANIEINYLLQKMEEHEGIVILATNFKNNIDDAFMRRMHFAIEFPRPDEEHREKIWKNIFPDEMPLDADIDFCFLAAFNITGGNIKNIALSAAFLAAGESSSVKMKHIIRATKREFQKMGKICTSEEFREYYKLVI